MKDYASMSDEQIAVMVAGLCSIEGVSINEDGMAVRNVVDNSPGSYSGGDYIEIDFDPCNNPADAWLIITSSMISIRPVGNDGQLWEASGMGGMKAYHDKNPLRASMVVFLMMMEGE